MAFAQLVELLPPTPKICGSNPTANIIYSLNFPLHKHSTEIFILQVSFGE